MIKCENPCPLGKSDDQLFQFYAGTGKIQGLQTRGIHNLIKILEG